MADLTNIFECLSKIDISKHIEKKNGLDYLSWSFAWSELMRVCPDANYGFREPVFFPGGTCEVWVDLTVNGITRSMWLPVMDYKNKAMINPTSVDINKTRMRCLVKAIAMFGLGMSLYSGEDVPHEEPVPQQKPQYTSPAKKFAQIAEKKAQSKPGVASDLERIDGTKEAWIVKNLYKYGKLDEFLKKFDVESVNYLSADKWLEVKDYMIKLEEEYKSLNPGLIEEEIKTEGQA